jgi:hypothetical protein
MSGDEWYAEWCKLEEENQKILAQMWAYKIRAEHAENVIKEMIRLDSDCLDNNCGNCSWCAGRKLIKDLP